MLFADGSSAWNGLPTVLHQLLMKQQACSVSVKSISISPTGRWFVLYDDGTFDANLPPLCRRAFDSLVEEYSPTINNIWLGKRGMFCIDYEITDKLLTVAPQAVKFSKCTFSSHFVDKHSVWRTIHDFEKKLVDLKTFPPIRVVKKKNSDTWITLDNRRLFVFRKAGISSIRVLVLADIPENIKSYDVAEILPCKCKECQRKQKKKKSNDNTRIRNAEKVSFGTFYIPRPKENIQSSGNISLSPPKKENLSLLLPKEENIRSLGNLSLLPTKEENTISFGNLCPSISRKKKDQTLLSFSLPNPYPQLLYGESFQDNNHLSLFTHSFVATRSCYKGKMGSKDRASFPKCVRRTSPFCVNSARVF
jgi:hypothetical protein